jgi:translation initiation factor IF-1
VSKEDSIEVTGTVLEKFPSGLFSVQLEHDRVVLAHLAGRLRRNRIRVLAGDKVTMELSPYDLTKGRITFRHRLLIANTSLTTGFARQSIHIS